MKGGFDPKLMWDGTAMGLGFAGAYCIWTTGGGCGGTITDGPMPPSAVWGTVWVAGEFLPCMTVEAM